MRASTLVTFRSIAFFVIVASVVADDVGGAANKTSARPAPKPAFEWTVEERLAERTDPAKIRARLSAAERAAGVNDGLSVSSATTGHSNLIDVIDGRRDPGAFLEWEVFERLVRVAFATDPAVARSYREGYQERVERLNLPDDLWVRLETITASYRESLESRHSPVATCSARFDALQQARREFGRRTFDRFLYEVLVPEMVISVSGPRASAVSMRYVNGGCR